MAAGSRLGGKTESATKTPRRPASELHAFLAHVCHASYHELTTKSHVLHPLFSKKPSKSEGPPQLDFFAFFYSAGGKSAPAKRVPSASLELTVGCIPFRASSGQVMLSVGSSQTMVRSPAG